MDTNPGQDSYWGMAAVGTKVPPGGALSPGSGLGCEAEFVGWSAESVARFVECWRIYG